LLPLLLAAVAAAGSVDAAELTIAFDPVSAEVPRPVMRAIAAFAEQARSAPVTLTVPARQTPLTVSRLTALRAALAQTGLVVREKKGEAFRLEYADPEPVRATMASKLETMRAVEAGLWVPPAPVQVSVSAPPKQLWPPPSATAAAEAAPEPAPVSPMPAPVSPMPEASIEPAVNPPLPVAAVPIAPPVPELPSAKRWRAEPGATLKAVLTGWADNAGWQVEWAATSDWILKYGTELDGDFCDAARRVTGGFWAAKPVPQLDCFTNNVVVVSTGSQP
jgi:hypothetical protein